METAIVLLGFALVQLLAVASPGPSFMLVAQAAIGSGRRAGLAAALGTMLGALAWAAAALFGLQVLFARFEWLHLIMRIGGALYLLYLAFMLWRHARDPMPEVAASAEAGSSWRSFRRALLLALSNPKIMVFFGSVFLSLLPADMPGWMAGLVLAIVAVNEFTWYALVTLLFSGSPARAVYRRAKVWLDRVMGGALALLGLRLALSDR